MGVLQVRPSLAVEAQGVLEFELHVVGAAVLEVVEDHGADADSAGDGFALSACQIRVLLGNHRTRAVDGFLKHLAQQHRDAIAAAALGPARRLAGGRLIIPNQDHAKADVAQAVGIGPIQQLRAREPLLEMQRLAKVHHIEAARESELGEAVVAGREVAGRVEGPAIGTLEQHRLGEALSRKIDHGRALVLLGQTLGGDLGQHRAHLVFVIRLALPRIERHPEQVIDPLELGEARVFENLPEVAGLGLAVLKQLGPPAGILFQRRVALGGLAGPHVQLIEERHPVGCGIELGEGQAFALPATDQPAECGAPVA